MANGTIRKLFRFDVVLLHQLFAERNLILWRSVFEIVNLFYRSNEFFRLTMAIETPRHLQRALLPDERHHVDVAVADLARHAFLDMNAVVEVRKIRKIVNAVPFERALCSVAGPNRLKHRGACPDLRVTGHAGMCRWNSRERGFFYAGVAIAAADAEAVDVVLMTEGNRLFFRNIHVGEVSRPIHIPTHPSNKSHKKKNNNDAGPRDNSHAWVKNLGHELSDPFGYAKFRI